MDKTDSFHVLPKIRHEVLEDCASDCLGQRSLNSQSPPHVHVPRRVLPSSFLFVTLNLILDPGMVTHLGLRVLYRGSSSQIRQVTFPSAMQTAAGKAV